VMAEELRVDYALPEFYFVSQIGLSPPELIWLYCLNHHS